MRIRNIIHRISALMLAFMLTLMCGGVFAEGSGAVITISTPADFAALSKNCVYDSYSRGMQVTLLNDIDMEGTEIEPMKIFCGTFDGGGHYINNISFDFDGSVKGLCFELGEGGELRNLNVTGTVKAKKNAEASTSINDIIGSVAKNAGLNADEITKKTTVSVLGGIVGVSSGRIINCSFGGSAEGDTAVGGIVGENRDGGYIESCSSSAEVLGNKSIGGIVGRNYGYVKLCRNEGRINSSPVEDSRNIGGIAGTNSGVLEGCTNSAEIGYKNVGYDIGGIAGGQSGCILECENSGAVLGDTAVGGIFGRFEPYTDIDIENLDELRENVKNDIDDTRQNVKNDVNSQRERINSDINDILDRLGGSGTGLIGTLLGLGGTRSALADTINSLAGSGGDLIGSVSDSARSISDSIGALSNSGAALLDTLSSETVNDFSEAVDSINQTVETAETVSDNANTLISDIDGLVNEINEAYDAGDLRTVGDRLDDLSGRLDYVQDTMLDPMSTSITSAMNALTRSLNSLRGDANDLTDAITEPLYQISNDLDAARERIEDLKKRIDDTKQDIDNIKDKIDDATGSIPTLRPGIIGRALDSLIFTEVFADDMVNLSGDELKNETKNITSIDVSIPRNVSGMPTDNAVVIYCVNSGDVSGDSGIGGIGGTIGIESAVRNGKELTLPEGKVINAESVVKAVVNGCVSEGKITGKTGYAGGTVGDAQYGIIKNCAARTEISGGEDGEFIGGIAGESYGKIDSCIAIADMNGKESIGGIAGQGKDITTCYALPRIDGTPEKSGAIAGIAEGTVTNNYFVKEGLSGVNGADFNGKAVALEWNEMIGIGTVPAMMNGFSDDNWFVGSDDTYLPQNRVLSDNTASIAGAVIRSKSADMAGTHFRVAFIIDNETVTETTVDYGTIIDPLDIPELKPRDGFCPQWDKDTTEPIVRNTEFRAEYTDAVRTIGTDEEPPLLLVEGNFRDGTTVTARAVDRVGDYDSAYKVIGSYEFEITPEYSGKIKVHIRDKAAKGDHIGIVRGGKAMVLDAERDGSYLVFELDEPCGFAVLDKRSNLPAALGILLIAAGLIIIIILIARKKAHSR